MNPPTWSQLSLVKLFFGGVVEEMETSLQISKREAKIRGHLHFPANDQADGPDGNGAAGINGGPSSGAQDFRDSKTKVVEEGNGENASNRRDSDGREGNEGLEGCKTNPHSRGISETE